MQHYNLFGLYAGECSTWWPETRKDIRLSGTCLGFRAPLARARLKAVRAENSQHAMKGLPADRSGPIKPAHYRWLRGPRKITTGAHSRMGFVDLFNQAHYASGSRLVCNAGFRTHERLNFGELNFLHGGETLRYLVAVGSAPEMSELGSRTSREQEEIDRRYYAQTGLPC